MKTSELIGPALDWAVAKCEGKKSIEFDDLDVFTDVRGEVSTRWKPSTNWNQGGPIIERENIWLSHNSVSGIHGAQADADGHYFQKGNTTLINAMRCYVASKLGDDVEIPEKLK